MVVEEREREAGRKKDTIKRRRESKRIKDAGSKRGRRLYTYMDRRTFINVLGDHVIYHVKCDIHSVQARDM